MKGKRSVIEGNFELSRTYRVSGTGLSASCILFHLCSFCKDLSGFTRDGEGRLRGHMPSKYQGGLGRKVAWLRRVVLDLALLDSNLCLDVWCGIMRKK